jgi:steroid delta-isomerase
VTIACLVAAETTTLSARADPDSDRAAITERLQRWTAAFNARDAAGTCDLFAPDLVSSVPGILDGSRDALCARLNALQAKPGLQLHYDNPDIREIIVSGDLAVARLFWTLTTRKGSEQDVTTEAGMDIFRRQPDGKWSIDRFLSFTTTPNKLLQ